MSRVSASCDADGTPAVPASTVPRYSDGAGTLEVASREADLEEEEAAGAGAGSPATPVVEVDEETARAMSCWQIGTTYSGLIAKMGVGFFADAYDLFVVDIALAIIQEMHRAEGDESGIGATTGKKTAFALASSFGAAAGMLVFGVLGDEVCCWASASAGSIPSRRRWRARAPRRRCASRSWRLCSRCRAWAC